MSIAVIAEKMARVLIIDDERGPRESLRFLLKPNYDVCCADCVDVGVAELKKQPFDLVIMDIRMPGKNGIVGLSELRKIDQQVSIVLLTGYGALETAQQALRLGATDYMNKPFDTNEMQQLVGKYVGCTQTERKRTRMLMELRDLNQRLWNDLASKEHLASMGQSSAEFAHDLRNPLTIVTGYVNLLSKQLERKRDVIAGEYDTTAEYLNIIEKNVERCSELAQMWNKMGKSGLMDFAPVRISQVMQDLVVGVEPLACTESVDVEYDAERVTGVINGSRPQLLRALHNVVTNAIQAVQPGKGKVRIECRDDAGDVTVRVSDNGCGMSPEVLSRIFEPYFTTKADDEGTGLGMGITKKIVEEHGGLIRVTSEPGRGTVVDIRLPKCEMAAAAAAS